MYFKLFLIPKFIWHHHWFFIVLIALGLFCYFVVGLIEVILDVQADLRNRKREPMFWCNRHGYFRKVNCLPLFPEFGNQIEGSFVCPSCYRDVVFTQPNKRLN